MLEESGTGVATYARGLEAALAVLGGAPPWTLTDRFGAGVTERARGRTRRERWWRWLVARVGRPVVLRRRGNGLIGTDVFRLGQRHFREHGTVLRVRAPGEGPGIMHWTYPVPIALEGWANIYTVHDAIPFTHPSLSPIDAERHRRLLRVVADRAAAILTVSADAATALRASGALDPAVIVDCGQAVLTPAPCTALPSGLTVGGYFLMSGAVEPRKNVAGVVQAWQASKTALPLVIAGPDGWRADELQPFLSAQGVVRLPYQPGATMVSLQAGARALLFPSFAEGFGLPIIEAMALGTPVMTAAGGATGEVAGDAALLVDPHRPDAMADAIARLGADGALRARLIAAGRVRAADFSLERFAARLAGLHRAVVVNAGAPH